MAKIFTKKCWKVLEGVSQERWNKGEGKIHFKNTQEAEFSKNYLT